MADPDPPFVELALRAILGKPALVIGPDVGNAIAVEHRLNTKLSKLLDTGEQSADRELLYTIDAVLDQGLANESEIRNSIVDAMREAANQDALINILSQQNWSGVISLSYDSQFYLAWKQFLSKQPISRRPTVVAAPLKNAPKKASLYIALLGHLDFDSDAERIVVGASEYLDRKRQWSAMFQSLPDVLRASSLLLLGFTTAPQRALDFLDEYFRLAPKYPSQIMLPSNDPLLSDPTFRRLTERHSKIVKLPDNLEEFLAGMQSEHPAIYKDPLFARLNQSRKYLDEVDQVSDIFSLVPRKSECKFDKTERNRLLDYLFRPASSNWEPYAASMAFHRDVEKRIEDAIMNATSRKEGGDRLVSVWGEAGVGKTTTLKTVAYKIAQDYDLVLWLKSSAQGVDDSRIRQGFQSIVRIANETAANLVVFFDDPVSAPISIDEAQDLLDRTKKSWCLVVCTRTSEILHTHDGTDDGLRQALTERDVEIPYVFSDKEMETLPRYLADNGFAQSPEMARAMLTSSPSSSAKDVLASLWFVLPQTQASLRDSVEAELRRLGDPAGAVRDLASSIPSKMRVAQRAYQMVAICSWFHNIPVPIEVLVSALRISYGTWLDQCSGNRPLWGLLYDEPLGELESFGYRTRNQRVAEILCDVMNESHAGHSGELAALKDLIGACTSSAPPYKSFLKMLLVSRRKELVKHFGAEEALELYDCALDAYPLGFGLIEHHRAAVLRKIEGRAPEAYKILQRLLRQTELPNPDNDSPLNLHNSGAATVTQMIREHTIEPSEGVLAVEKHVQSALRINQFSTHSYHIQAKALLTLADEIRHLDLIASHKARLSAVRTAERGLWIEQLYRRHGSETYPMLIALRSNANYSTTDVASAKEQARQYFLQSKDQTLFAMAARRLIGVAVNSGKGGDFKKADDYLHDVCVLIRHSQIEVGDELRWCRLDLWDSWKARHGKGPADWHSILEDVGFLMEKPQNRDDIRLNFWLAVSLWNMGKRDEGEPRFQWLRQMMWQSNTKVLAYYIGESSSPLELQGTVRRTDQRRLIKCSNLNIDLHTRGFEPSQDGDTVHLIIGFTLAGPIALPVDSVKVK